MKIYIKHRKFAVLLVTRFKTSKQVTDGTFVFHKRNWTKLFLPLPRFHLSHPGAKQPFRCEKWNIFRPHTSTPDGHKFLPKSWTLSWKRSRAAHRLSHSFGGKLSSGIIPERCFYLPRKHTPTYRDREFRNRNRLIWACYRNTGFRRNSRRKRHHMPQSAWTP